MVAAALFACVIVFVQLVLVISSQAAQVGIDGSTPPSISSWRLARVYSTLQVQRGVDVSFRWLGSQGLKLAQNLTEYEACVGNGTVLVPDGTYGGSYVFQTANLELGQYYFYNPMQNGLYCKTNMRAIVNVVETQSCNTARTAGRCKLLSQCSWRTKSKTKGACATKAG